MNVGVPMETLVFGGTGAPTGMFLITGSGLKVALLNVASNLPMLIGPSTMTPFFTKVIEDDGWVQRVDNSLDQWQLSPTAALRSGETVLIAEPTQNALASIAPDPAGQTAIRNAGLRSLVLLPLIGRGRLLGVLTLGMTRPDRRFTKADRSIPSRLAPVRLASRMIPSGSRVK